MLHDEDGQDGQGVRGNGWGRGTCDEASCLDEEEGVVDTWPDGVRRKEGTFQQEGGVELIHGLG